MVGVHPPSQFVFHVYQYAPKILGRVRFLQILIRIMMARRQKTNPKLRHVQQNLSREETPPLSIRFEKWQKALNATTLKKRSTLLF